MSLLTEIQHRNEVVTAKRTILQRELSVTPRPLLSRRYVVPALLLSFCAGYLYQHISPTKRKTLFHMLEDVTVPLLGLVRLV